MKIIYFGTPSIAVNPLVEISKKHQVVCVVTQPDRPIGRSNKLVFCPVKQKALEMGIPVLQYENVSKNGVQDLQKYNADIIITCAFGQYLSRAILDLTQYGVYNIHGSLLPKYRGASPIQSAIINGDKVTGVTILKSTLKMDAGDILLKKSIDIDDDMTSGQLFDKVSNVGASAIDEALDMLESNNYTLIPQDESLVTTTTKIDKDMAKIDFDMTAKQVVDLVRGMNPSPVAWTSIDGVVFKIYKAVESNMAGDKPGSIVIADAKRGLHIMCLDHCVELLEIKPENSKLMTAKSYLNGKKIIKGNIDE